MKSFRMAGFTIVETMLVLAITGLLVVGVLVGTTGSINTQRYRDSVRSLQSKLKKVYTEVSDVSNERGTNWTCSVQGSGKDSSLSVVQGGQTNIGQSECVIMGKYIASTDGKTLSIKTVIGYHDSSIDGRNGISDFSDYLLTASSISSEEYSLQWGSSVYSKLSGDEKSTAFSILILQSPVSGVNRTFIDKEENISDSSINNLVTVSNLANSAKLCVDSNGIFLGNVMGIGIDANATGASGVEMLGDNSGC